jgi:ferric-dicitrate binding protein FerR (iron transport regulator)
MAEPQARKANMLTELRASDAERAEVADLLKKHFMDGRLDQAEFDERLGAALSAKTRGELTALFDDLPRIVANRPVRPSPRRRPRRPMAPLAFVCLLGCLVIAAASSLGSTGRVAVAHAGIGSHSVVVTQSGRSFASVLVAVLLVAIVCLAVRFFRHPHQRG